MSTDDCSKKEAALKEVAKDECLKIASKHHIVSPSGEIQTEGWLFDFRSILLRSDVMEMIATLFWEHFKEKHPFQVGGPETAAIPLVSAIVMKGEQLGYRTNGFFIRKERKLTGLQNIIEGTLNSEDVILVDDLINNGRTFKRQLEVLSHTGHTVKEVFTLLRFRDSDAYKDLPPLTSVFSLNDFALRVDTNQEKQPEIAQTGFKAQWKFTSGNPNLFYIVPKSRPAVDGKRLYFGADNGTFWALDQKDGNVKWKFKIRHRSDGKAIFSSPVVHAGIVYFGAYDGSVYALDTQTGNKIWEFSEADWVGSSPAIAPDLGLLFIGLEFGLFTRKGGIVALDLKTGEKRWCYYDMDGLTHASPGYSQKHRTVVIGCNDHHIYAFDAKKGMLKWTYGTGNEVKYGVTFDEKRRCAAIGSMDGNVYLLDIKTGEHTHTFETRGPIYSTPLISGDRLYVGSYDKHLHCFDLKTKEVQWRFETLGKILTSPVIINNRLYIGSNDGFLYELTLDGIQTDLYTTGERITNNVVYNTDTHRYFLPTFTNEIYCLKKKEQNRP